MYLTTSQIDSSNNNSCSSINETITIRKLLGQSEESENLKSIGILINENDDQYFSVRKKFKSQNILIKQINDVVDNIIIPKKWAIQSINPPNINCKELTKEIAEIIYHFYAIFPIRIAPSIEEGILLNYKNFDNKKEMSIEIYNDLDIAAIIICKNSILKSTDVENKNFSEIIEIFKDI